jgi:UDP-N-acetylglucosamine enolpyruvyl transferase
MIEIGSFIGMAAITESEITIKNTSFENLGIIPDSFRRLGSISREEVMIFLYLLRNIMK